jgi:RimJ/RimL family protein N-acetyltransferase
MPRNSWMRAADVDEFKQTTIPYLAAEPAANNLLLTVFDRLRTDGTHAFGERDPQLLTWIGPDGNPEGAVVRTPPFPYILSAISADAVHALIELLLEPGSDLDGHEANVTGDCEEAFVSAWTARTGYRPRVIERNRLYRLDKLVAPDPMPAGKARQARSADVPVVARWIEGFWSELSHAIRPDASTAAPAIAEARIAEGAFWLWLDEEGTPVSLAGYTPIVAGASRIGPVYTPRELRGRGYAGAVTTAAGRALLSRGADEVLLFTDLANPTSNALYQRIGYREVSDRVRLELKS